MLLRSDERGVLAIGQPSHAWISGQLARAWGNARFPPPDPREAVCLAADQHDIGMASWDLEPTRNAKTGLPHSFIEMSLETHLKLWSAAPRRVLAQSRYSALLVSMHGSRLYRRRNLDELPEAEADAVRAYLAAQRQFQNQLAASLGEDPLTAAWIDEEVLARNSQLIWTWDYLSLVMCLDWESRMAKDVPAYEGPLDMELTPTGEQLRLGLEPWPFAAERISVRCEGRRLTGRYQTDEQLRAALGQARWETVEFELLAATPPEPRRRQSPRRRPRAA